jgi:hypothetical protein
MTRIAVLAAFVFVVLGGSIANAQSNSPAASFFGGGGFGYVARRPITHSCMLNSHTIGTPDEAAARGIPCVRPAFEARRKRK